MTEKTNPDSLEYRALHQSLLELESALNVERPVKIDTVWRAVREARAILEPGRMEREPTVWDYQRVYDTLLRNQGGLDLFQLAAVFTTGNVYVMKGVMDTLVSRELVVVRQQIGQNPTYVPTHLPPKSEPAK